VSSGIFLVASDSSMCPGVESASKNKYQDNPGGKEGRCVRLTTYHLHVPNVKKSGGLNLLESCGSVQACNGTALPFAYTRQDQASNFKEAEINFHVCNMCFAISTRAFSTASL